jgi:hypothetical protein
MLDTNPVTTAITAMIRTGTTERQIVTAVAHMFPDLTRSELVAAAQDAMAAAERQAARRH